MNNNYINSRKISCISFLAAMLVSVSVFGQVLSHEWRFENSLNDAEVNGITGAPNGFPINPVTHKPIVTYSSSHRQGANSLSLDASQSQFIDLGNPAFASGASVRTISAWALTNNVTGVRTIFAYGSPNNNQSMFIGQNGTSLVAGAYGNVMTVSNFWTSNMWHHIALIYDGTTAKLYADGVQVASSTTTWNTALSKAYIGRNVNGSEYWQGLIDNVQIYPQAFSAADVAGIVQQGSVKVAWWMMEQDLDLPSGSTANNNPTYTTNNRVDNYAVTLDGTSQFISTTNISTFSMGSNPFSVSGWARTNTTTGEHRIIAYGTANNGQSVYIGQSGTSLVAGTMGSVLTLTNFWTAGAWHHVCLTYDGVSARLYADGVLVKGPTAMTFSVTGTKAWVGRSVDADPMGAAYWSGDLDDVKVFTTPLSVPEVQTMGTIPGAPTGLTVGAVTPSTVDLSWTASTTTPCSYHFENSLNATTGFSFPGITITGTSLKATDLPERTTYYFRVKTIGPNNADYVQNNSDYVPVVSATTLAYAPTALTAFSGSPTAATLNWADNSKVETGYRIERSTTSGSGYTVITTTAANVTKWSDVGRTAGTTYYYRVTAMYTGGNTAYSNEAAVTTMTTAKQAQIQNALTNFAFQYKYDERGRMTHKKVPGAGWVYMVYDNRDRLVMTQDSVQRPNKEWLVTKYDSLNRPVITAKYVHTTYPFSQSAMSALISTTKFCEYYSSSFTTNHGYSNRVFPTTSLTVLTANYYDNYGFVGAGGLPEFTSTYAYLNSEITIDTPNNIPSQDATENKIVVGHPTGSKVNVLGTTTYLKSVVYYDAKYRTIQTIADNNKLGIDRITNVVDFAGRVLKTKTTHKTSTHNDQTIARRFVYDHASRVKQLFHNVNTNGEKLLLQNEYNEIGQLVDKKLHSTDNGTSFKQSVDYRYNIRGWLATMNNSQLTSDANITNDDTNDGKDLFGFELGYNNSIGTGNASLYNGNISAMKWSSNQALGTIKDVGYNYSYDALNRIAGANYLTNTSGAWSNATNAFSESGYQYDQNGNIKTLKRFGVNGSVMDSLHYTYSGNQLLAVKDNGGDLTKGFTDGNTSGNDYSYDGNGNMNHDLNKSLGSTTSDNTHIITYNHLNLPVQVVKNTNEKIVYTYDAGGRKLTQQVFNASGTPIKTTEYDGEFIYQGDTLQFVNHEEGRITMKLAPNQANSTALNEYQYHLKDHLGNVRMTFTTAATLDVNTATYETANATVEQSKFLRYANARRINATLFDHTNGSSTGYSERLSGSANEKYGLARSISVMPGDVIQAEVYAKYADPNSANWNSALTTLISQVTSNNASVVFDGASYSTSTSSFPVGYGTQVSKTDNGAPKAYLNWLVFDRNFVFLTGGFKQISTVGKETGTDVAHEYLTSGNITITQPGYVYIYLSNEASSPVEVYFDDFKVTQSNNLPVVQQEDFYPFGLTFNSYTRESSVKNKYLYNAGSELQDDLDLGVYETFYRMLDPAGGRWWQVDPMVDNMYDWSPYNYSFNNPVRYNDPKGDCPPGVDCGAVASALGEHISNNPDGAVAGVTGFLTGLGNAAGNSISGLVNAVAHPLQTLDGLASLSSVEGQATAGVNMAIAGAQKVDQFQNGTTLDKGIVAGEVTGAVAEVAVGTKGVGAMLKTAEVGTVAKSLKVTASTGTEVTGFTRHAVNQAINRGVKPGGMLDALKKPLKVGEVVIDSKGRPSQRFVGSKAEVAVNPQSGKVVSVNPTSSKKAAKLANQQ